MLAWLAESALMQSPAGAFLKSVPAWAWKAAAIVALLVGGYLYHQHRAHKAIAAAKLEQKQADDTAWAKALAKAHADALTWKARANAQAATIANDERKIHEQAVASNAAAADALRLRGPGAASAAHCGQGDHTGAPAAADRHDQATSGASATAAQVPSGDWAIVPWSWVVQISQEHDDLLADVKSVIANDQKQRAAWPKSGPVKP